MVIFKSIKAFTLLEVLIVVAIIGILAAISYPAYTNYLIKTNRTDVQAEMVSLAHDFSSYKMAKGNFDDLTLKGGGASINYPDNKPLYTITLDSDELSWELKAEPNTGTIQADSGAITLDSTGKQCWEKISGACEPW